MTKNPVQNSRVLSFAPRPEVVLERLRKLCESSDNVRWSQHAQDRMEERDITTRDALEVLRKGRLKGDVETGNKLGELKLKVVRLLKGRREAGVVAVIIRENAVLVKTVE